VGGQQNFTVFESTDGGRVNVVIAFFLEKKEGGRIDHASQKEREGVSSSLGEVG